MLHSKEKGALGEAEIICDLISQGFPAFKEFGDNSKVDLIALINNVPIKIQVKSYHSGKNGAVGIGPKKSGPGYRFTYTRGQIDVFAVYVYDRDLILYVSAKKIIESGGLSIRLDATKNNQQKGVHKASDYISLKEALRDYTPVSLDWGEDIVQTTTEEVLASEN